VCGTEKEGAKGKVNDTPREREREEITNHITTAYAISRCLLMKKT